MALQYIITNTDETVFHTFFDFIHVYTFQACEKYSQITMRIIVIFEHSILSRGVEFGVQKNQNLMSKRIYFFFILHVNKIYLYYGKFFKKCTVFIIGSNEFY